MNQPNVVIQVDNKWLEQYAKEYIEKYCETFLRPEWLSIKDLERITGRKRKWIMEYIIDDPFVRKNGIAKRDGDSERAQWLVDAGRIRPFLRYSLRELNNS